MTMNDEILVVEDNEDDVYFFGRAVRAAAPHAHVRFITDGQSALEYLRGEGEYTNRAENPLPKTLFLDLKLPFVNGLEVLEAIRRDPALKELRVFILTSSSEDRDRERAEALGVEGYLVKPPTREMLGSILGTRSTAPTQAARR